MLGVYRHEPPGQTRIEVPKDVVRHHLTGCAGREPLLEGRRGRLETGERRVALVRTRTGTNLSRRARASRYLAAAKNPAQLREAQNRPHQE